MTCPICLETYNKSSQQCVSCHYCDYKACSKCVKRYILQSADSHCMQCKKEWDRLFMIDNLSKKFVNNDYKKHKEQLLFEKEKNLLIVTQPYVEREIELELLNKELQSKMQELNQLKYKTLRLKHDIFLVKTQPIHGNQGIVQKCPNENCRGFVSSDWKCNLCDTHVCETCMKTKSHHKHDNHTCNPDDIKSAQVIREECKKCPKCATMISKIDGCDLMWCVLCHTAFNWITGLVEKGNIHNPHYFDYLRQKGQQERNPLEVQCGREIDKSFIQTFRTLMNDTIVDDDEYDEFSCFYENKLKKVANLHSKILPKLVESSVSDNMDLRIAFMRNKISEDQWKKTLHQRQKKQERNKCIISVLSTHVNAMIDILYRVAYTEDWDTGHIEIYNLCKYTSTELSKISDNFNCDMSKYVTQL